MQLIFQTKLCYCLCNFCLTNDSACKSLHWIGLLLSFWWLPLLRLKRHSRHAHVFRLDILPEILLVNKHHRAVKLFNSWLDPVRSIKLCSQNVIVKLVGQILAVIPVNYSQFHYYASKIMIQSKFLTNKILKHIICSVFNKA